MTVDAITPIDDVQYVGTALYEVCCLHARSPSQVHTHTRNKPPVPIYL